MWGGYWSPLQTMYGYGTMMSPYYAGGLGIPYMMGMGGLGYGLGASMYGMGMGMPYPYGMTATNLYAYTGMDGSTVSDIKPDSLDQQQ
ncbi:hypothetical protein C356_06861 [Cryptococcus neoformans c45]|nr:hypothetical protein C356_06861 [Cryptococcus neoformans var. grubii c45]